MIAPVMEVVDPSERENSLDAVGLAMIKAAMVTVFVFEFVKVIPLGIVTVCPNVMAELPEKLLVVPVSVRVPVPVLKDVPSITILPPKERVGFVTTFIKNEPPELTSTSPVKVFNPTPVEFVKVPPLSITVVPEIVMAKLPIVVVPVRTSKLGKV